MLPILFYAGEKLLRLKDASDDRARSTLRPSMGEVCKAMLMCAIGQVPRDLLLLFFLTNAGTPTQCGK